MPLTFRFYGHAYTAFQLRSMLEHGITRVRMILDHVKPGGMVLSAGREGIYVGPRENIRPDAPGWLDALHFDDLVQPVRDIQDPRLRIAAEWYSPVREPDAHAAFLDGWNQFPGGQDAPQGHEPDRPRDHVRLAGRATLRALGA